MKQIVAAALLSSVFALPAYAAGGAYAGLKVGNASVGFNTLSKSSDTAYGVLVGYQYNPNLAVEGEYTDLGRFTTATGVTGKSDAWGLSAVGILPLDSFSLYGKLGIARSGTSTSAATGRNRTAATYGLGGQFDATPMIGLRLSWERYGVGMTGQNAEDDLYSLAAVFKF